MTRPVPGMPAQRPPLSIAHEQLLVSIVIRNYNYADFLREAIDSALAQTYAATEVIVVDDGSTDGSRAILRSYADRCHIVLQENGGEGAAINSGFAACRGGIVLFLDSDDVLYPRAVEKIVARWNPRVTRVHFRMRVISAAGLPEGIVLPASDIPDLSFDDYLKAYGEVPCIGQSFEAYSAAALGRILPLDASAWRRAPDSYLSALTTAQGQTHFIAEPLGAYRWHRANLALRNAQFAGGQGNVVMKGPNLHRAIAGFVGPERWASYKLSLPSGHWLNRILSYRLDRKNHPFPDDRLPRLSAKAFAAILRRPKLTAQRRVLFLLGLAAAAALPAMLLRPALPALLRFARASAQRGWLKRAVAFRWPALAMRKPELAPEA